MDSPAASIIKAFLRNNLSGLGYILMAYGVTAEQWESLLGGMAIVIWTLVYIAYVKIRDRWLLNTAAALEPTPPGLVAQLVTKGVKAPAKTPDNEVPVVYDTRR